MKMENLERELLGVRDVAHLLGVSARSVWRMRDSGAMPGAVKVLGSVRWRVSDLRQWIADGCPNLRVSRRVNR